eukprot:CAMPEP_0113631784 /NCGR_PEP_ID=MMETSP0017_2-20120614/16516_1 /TAXON_ID=2856 /ORGANISM="Cylindrotheca closterium" /LENGTH=102 /DNA_ID=CAMNT_0000542305 /DNA_START=155 /DNA_END=460 /DNA_ORIENTATION=- /assembly_acc=CAM_ASM_000147
MRSYMCVRQLEDLEVFEREQWQLPFATPERARKTSTPFPSCTSNHGGKAMEGGYHFLCRILKILRGHLCRTPREDPKVWSTQRKRVEDTTTHMTCEQGICKA